MKQKVAELEGALLDAAVAKAEAHAEVEVSSFTARGEKRLRCEVVLPGEDGQTYWTEYLPSADWEVGGPIIERERIAIGAYGVLISAEPERVWGTEWKAWVKGSPSHDDNAEGAGPTPLIAAMRAYVASKFGDVVELP